MFRMAPAAGGYGHSTTTASLRAMSSAAQSSVNNNNIISRKATTAAAAVGMTTAGHGVHIIANKTTGVSSAAVAKNNRGGGKFIKPMPSPHRKKTTTAGLTPTSGGAVSMDGMIPLTPPNLSTMKNSAAKNGEGSGKQPPVFTFDKTKGERDFGSSPKLEGGLNDGRLGRASIMGDHDIVGHTPPMYYSAPALPPSILSNQPLASPTRR